MRAGMCFEIAQTNASLRAHRTGTHGGDAVQACHVDHDTALQRNQLAVVTGAAPTEIQWDTGFCTGCHNGKQFVLIAWTNSQLGELLFQLVFKHRAKPVKVT